VAILLQECQVKEEARGQEEAQMDLVKLVADIVSAYVSNNPVPATEMPALLASVHAAFSGLGQSAKPTETTAEKLTPAQIRKSIKPDALISFIDGKPYKTLKRHLSKHGMTLEEYRERYGLPRDYPFTAPSYSEQRSALAKKLGLGLGNRSRKAAPKLSIVSEPGPKARGGADRQETAKSAAGSAKARRPKKGKAAPTVK
jgi:predicted transcriptional regulator